MVWLLTLPVRLGFGATKMSMKTGYRAGRLVGYRRIAVLMVGIAIGLLLAPTTGRQLREKLRELADKRLGHVPDDELGERVRFELSHSPRTWHLPQPEVQVDGGRVSLSGRVPHESGRSDLERAAAAVPGVAGVDNRMVVASPNGH